MGYVVIKDFTDSQYRNHVYVAGDKFPCEGSDPTEERIRELLGVHNKARTPLIVKSGDADKELSPEDMAKKIKTPKRTVKAEE